MSHAIASLPSGWISTLVVAGSLAAPVYAERPRPSAEFVRDWVVVRLSRPLERLPTDDEPRTGWPGLDSALHEASIHRVEHALGRAILRGRGADRASLARHGLDRTYRLHVSDGTDVEALLGKLRRLAEVEVAERDPIMRIHGGTVPNDPRFAEQWYLPVVEAPVAWQTTVGEEITVAVLDTGVDSDHPDLVGRTLPGIDLVNDDADPEDDSGHGTRVASLIAARTDNAEGIAGVCWNCRILPIKVFDDQGLGAATWIAEGLVWATDHGARVVNLSGGSSSPTSLLEGAVGYAHEAGVAFAASAGNLDKDGLDYPAAYVETIAVGATDQQDRRASPFCGDPAFGSTYGPRLDLVAPGEFILSATLGGGYDAGACGTSFSAPLASGLAALVMTLNPSTGRGEMKHLLNTGAVDQLGRVEEDLPGHDPYHGWGRLDMARTLTAATASLSLRVEGKAATRVSYQSANPLAATFDFVRGSLATLADDGQRVTLSPLTCLLTGSPVADTVGYEDTTPPPSGQGFYYLGRFHGAAGPGSFGASSAGRDREQVLLNLADRALAGDQLYGNFGRSATGVGDVDGDGFDDVMVGAPFYANGEYREGMAFLYPGSKAGTQADPTFVVESDQSFSEFGHALAGAGDVDGDGFDDVAVGAFNYRVAQGYEGRVFVYRGSPSGPLAPPHRTLDGDQFEAHLGFRLAAAGDVDGDGFDDLIVAAAGYSAPEEYEGRAYLYAGSAAGLSDTPLWSFETDQVDALMHGVGGAGDVNGDGFDDVVVGSPLFDGPGGADSGRAWFFLGGPAGPSPVPDAVLDVGVAGARFGNSVSGAGDVNGDGFDDVVVGAFRYDGGEPGEGAAFVFHGSVDGLSTTPVWSFEADQRHAWLGHRVRSAGDVDGDGFDDVIVSAPEYDLTRSNEGRVWLFAGSASGLGPSPVWTDAGNQTSASLGQAAAAAGDVNGDGFGDVIVGAYQHDGEHTDSGAAFVFSGPLAAPAAPQCGAGPVAE